MLIIADNLESMDFGALMKVYLEGNVENGACFYPEKSPEEQIVFAEHDFERFLRNNFFLREQARYYVWETYGRYIAALRLESFQDGLLLEALETCPDQRGRGYAKKLIRAVIGTLSTGTRIYSHVSKDNRASLATHTACGFVQIMEHGVEPDGTIDQWVVTMRYTV